MKVQELINLINYENCCNCVFEAIGLIEGEYKCVFR